MQRDGHEPSLRDLIVEARRCLIPVMHDARGVFLDHLIESGRRLTGRTDPPDTPPTAARIHFYLVNLDIEQDLKVGPITISPLPDIAEKRKRLQKFEAPPEVTASGVFVLPNGPDSTDPWQEFGRQPIQQMELLLSFAQRRHIQVIAPTIEHQIDGKWVWRGMHSWMLGGNTAYGVPWYMWPHELQGFIDRALPIVLDPARGEESGLRLALQFYRQNFRDDFVEMHYLKNWIAIEILYSRYWPDGSVVSNPTFRSIRRSFVHQLDSFKDRGCINCKSQVQIENRLGSLNHPSARTQASRFFSDIFANYPAQRISNRDLSAFLDIRNDITHGGVMKGLSSHAYEEKLNNETNRLRSLLERVILAMLGETPNLMSFSWEKWLEPR